MTGALLARSSRLWKRFACVSIARVVRSPLVSAHASRREDLRASDAKTKRAPSFLERRGIYSSAFLTNTALSDIQERTVDECAVGNGRSLDGKSESKRGKSDDGEPFSTVTHTEVVCEQRAKEETHIRTEGPIEVALSQAAARPQTADEDDVKSESISDIQDVDVTHPAEKDSSNEVVQIAHKATDINVDSVAMHVAHMIGIIEYENLAVLQAATSCTEDGLFSNLSFLMSIGFTEKELVDTISMHPSMLAMDLGKSLSRVVRFLQRIELDASFLKQVLLVQPGLASLLANRALQERAKALRELGFSAQDMATLLKQLGSNQLERFLTLPVEKLEPSFTYITDAIGLRIADATKLISSYPSVLLRNVEEEYASKMKILKEVFEDAKKVKKLFVHAPELLARKYELLEGTVLCLKDMVKDVKKLRDLIEAYPGLLVHRKSGILQVSKYLQSLGFDGTTIVTMIAREPYLIECGSDRLQKHVEFLRSKSFDDNAVRGLLENSTGLFFKSLQKRVAPKIEFLENQGITGESLHKYVKSRPQVCDRSLRKSMTPNLDFLLSLGFEKNSSSLKSALKVTLPHSHKSMQARIDYIISRGIETVDVHRMVREAPSLLVVTDSSLKQRMDFLVKVMNRPVQELVECPTFLLSNIKKTIIPRLKVFDWLSSKGLLKKTFTLSNLVETDESVFVKKFVSAHPEVLSIYKGSLQP